MEAKALILGNGRNALQIAEALAASGTKVVMATPNNADGSQPAAAVVTHGRAKIETLALKQPYVCNGTVGRFRLTMPGNSAPVIRTASSIILADEGVLQANFDLYGLAGGDAVITLSQLQSLLKGTEPDSRLRSAKKIVLINGLGNESHPAIAETVMQSALQLQQTMDCQTYIMTGNLKVAASGLEALYRQTKSAGTVYLKFDTAMPRFETVPDGGLQLIYSDEILHQDCVLTPDLMVIDERFEPSSFSHKIARQMGLELGPDGFVQSDNVHRATVFTNRKGIFVAGLSRGLQSKRAASDEVANVVQAVQALYREPLETPAGKAEIEPGRCIRCLTCLRSCAYGAITTDIRVQVDGKACQMCGVCEAECPRFAIQIHPPAEGTIADRIPALQAPQDTDEHIPAITAFCCSRSAVGAGELAACLGHQLPQGLRTVAVPCGGSVSLAHIFTAFNSGADGVLVLTCHAGNCHSEHGNTRARQRVDQIADLMPQLGLAPERLAWISLASNMGIEFAEALSGFEQTLSVLGPNKPLR